MDELIQKIYSVLLPIIDNEKLILILAVGGYGRNQLAPFSDIDLLFGYDQTLTKDKVKKIVEFFLLSPMGLRNKSWICSEKFQRNNFFFKERRNNKNNYVRCTSNCWVRKSF